MPDAPSSVVFLESPSVDIQPELLPWSGAQWKTFLSAWNSPDVAVDTLVGDAPFIFEPHPERLMPAARIKVHDLQAQQVFAFGMLMLFRGNMFAVAEQYGVQPIAVGLNHSLQEYFLHASQHQKVEPDPLELMLKIDKAGYSPEQLHQYTTALIRRLYALSAMCPANNTHVTGPRVQVLDVHEPFPYVASDWLFGNPNDADGTTYSPTALQAWRSKSPSDELLTEISKMPGLAYKGELYLRWLDGIRYPQRVTPLNEHIIEQHCPGALRFFHTWNQLGVSSRVHLRDVLAQVRDTSVLPLQPEPSADFG